MTWHAAWTDEELARVQELDAAGLTHAAIGAAIGRSEAGVSNKLRRLGSYRRARWPAADDAYLRANYRALGGQRCADHLGRPLACIYTRARVLGIQGPNGGALAKERAFLRRWTPERAEMLRLMSGVLTDAELSRQLDMPESSIRFARRKLGIGKPPDRRHALFETLAARVRAAEEARRVLQAVIAYQASDHLTAHEVATWAGVSVEELATARHEAIMAVMRRQSAPAAD